MADNIFLILGIQNREDCLSNALAYAFNESVELRNAFLQHICDKDPQYYKSCCAYTRIYTGACGTPDIVLLCETDAVADLIIIENKLKAEEGYDQTIGMPRRIVYKP